MHEPAAATCYRLGGAAGLAASGFPIVNIARADSATLKVGYIGCMSGPRTDFGAATPWVLERVKATVKDGLKIGGKNYAVEFILKDNQSDANQTNEVAKEFDSRREMRPGVERRR